MAIKVGINGFGRIGRIIARVCLQNPDLELSAINDPAIGADYISYLITFDSTHGKYNGNVTHTDNSVIIDDSVAKVFHEKQPASIPWQDAGVQYVVEASGMFTTLEKASGHLAADGVKRVIVTSPTVDIPMIILGVNDSKLLIDQKVLSCGSSTLYCLAPIIKVLEDNFGVCDGFVTSIHAMTPSLKPLDGLCLRGKHWRDHRSIHQNIIPAATGACRALGRIIPRVKDKLSGLAFRVPIVNVSVLDISVRLNTKTTLENILKCIKAASQNNFKDIIKISREQSVSSDFMGDSHSCIFDEQSSILLKSNFLKIVCWYENEYSYGCRVSDLIFFSEKQYCMQSSKLTYLRSMLLQTQDVIRRTERYRRERHLYCCDTAAPLYKLAFDLDETSSNQVARKTFTTEKSFPSQSSCKTMECVPRPRHDVTLNKAPRKQNGGSIFHSCVSISSFQPKSWTDLAKPLENVNGDFCETASNIEDSLRTLHTNYVTDIKSVLNHEQMIKMQDKLYISDTERCKTIANESVKSCGDGKNRVQMPRISCDVANDSRHEDKHSSLRSHEKENRFLLSATRIIPKPRIARSIHITKCMRRKRDALLKEAVAGLSKKRSYFREEVKLSVQSLLDNLAEQYQIHLRNNSRRFNRGSYKVEITNELNLMNTSILVKQNNSNDKEPIKVKIAETEYNSDLDREDNISEKHGIYHMNNKQLNDEEQQQRNMIPIYSFVNETICDKNDKYIPPDQLIPHRIKNVLEETELNTELIDDCEHKASKCQLSATTVSNRNETKLDIYDKLDSASESDSDNSFEITKRKSQVIKIGDLSNSLEDIERLDKICRIIEISDELSDELFSELDSQECSNKGQTKKWSFRDLCEKIHLDEFCHRVFGK